MNRINFPFISCCHTLFILLHCLNERAASHMLIGPISPNKCLIVLAAFPFLPAGFPAEIGALMKPLPKLSFSCRECYIRPNSSLYYSVQSPFYHSSTQGTKDTCSATAEENQKIIFFQVMAHFCWFVTWSLTQKKVTCQIPEEVNHTWLTMLCFEFRTTMKKHRLMKPIFFDLFISFIASTFQLSHGALEGLKHFCV